VIIRATTTTTTDRPNWMRDSIMGRRIPPKPSDHSLRLPRDQG
jgi:hypothetical protein